MNTEAPVRKRLLWLDMAKGIGIILVIYGHCCVQFDTFNKWICSFFMGMFFVISGGGNSLKTNWLQSDVKRILVPYYLWGILGLSLYFLKAIFHNHLSVREFFETLWKLLLGISQDNYPLWFLCAFFVSKVTFDAINNLMEKNNIEHNCEKNFYRLILVLFFAVIGYIYHLYSTSSVGVFRFDTGWIMLPFLLIGFYLMPVLKKPMKTSYKIVLFTICIFLNLISGLLFNTLVSVNSNDYGNILMFYISTVSGSMAIFLLCQFIEKIKFCSFSLSYFGKNSLDILCVHVFILTLIGVVCVHFLHIALPAVITTVLCLFILVPVLSGIKKCENSKLV